MENWTNLDKGREGVKNPGNFADVLHEWSLFQIVQRDVLSSNSLSRSSCTRSVRLQSMGNLTAPQVRMAERQSKSEVMKAEEMSERIASRFT